MHAANDSVRDFYETQGWTHDEAGTFVDTATFADLRPVTASYRRHMCTRVKHFIGETGTYLLDAGCGAIPHPEYLAWSVGFDKRVCVDFSATALEAARRQVADGGLYVQADLRNLPFRHGAFSGIVSAYVLHHVPKEEQESVVHELYRTLGPDSNCVIIYCRPSSVARRVWSTAVRRYGHLVRRGERASDSRWLSAPTPLYSHAYPYKWLATTFAPAYRPEVRIASLVDRHFTKTLVPAGRVGVGMLSAISWLEDRLPHAMARKGKYPMLILRKD